MNARDNLMMARFLLNMERINGLCKVVFSDVDVLTPMSAFRSEGPRADILRAIVVFLHATFEDVLRSRARQDNKTFTFYSGRDIDKALRKDGLDPAPFKPLYSPLCQMAKRRNRIVHEADLSNILAIQLFTNHGGDPDDRAMLGPRGGPPTPGQVFARTHPGNDPDIGKQFELCVFGAETSIVVHP